MNIEPVARVRTPYPVKFGVPRQPGLVDALESQVLFEPPYRNPDAVRGLEGFGRVWLVWGFSRNAADETGGPRPWSPTVRPPVLGGTRRVGVFASRSSFRPNGLAISAVRLLGVEPDAPYGDGSRGPLLRVGGVDMVDGSPVYDVKPYLPASDSHPDAPAGWRDGVVWPELEVEFPAALLEAVPPRLREGLLQVLRQDPRPGYARGGFEDRLYWVPLEDVVARFSVKGGVLTVAEVRRLDAAEMRRLRETGTVEGFEP